MGISLLWASVSLFADLLQPAIFVFTMGLAHCIDGMSPEALHQSHTSLVTILLPGPHCRPTESEYLGVRLWNQHFPQAPWATTGMLKSENLLSWRHKWVFSSFSLWKNPEPPDTTLSHHEDFLLGPGFSEFPSHPDSVSVVL